MRAFVFPGQGAQSIGMGKALAVAYPAAKAVFDEVDDALGQNLSKLIWDGDINTLTLTENAQPALMATSIAALYALKAEGVALETASFVSCILTSKDEFPLGNAVATLATLTSESLRKFEAVFTMFGYTQTAATFGKSENSW